MPLIENSDCEQTVFHFWEHVILSSYKSESNLALKAHIAMKKQVQERLYLAISVPMRCPCSLDGQNITCWLLSEQGHQLRGITKSDSIGDTYAYNQGHKGLSSASLR